MQPCLSLALFQERRSVAKQGLVLRRLSGADVSPELWDLFYDFYLDTVSSLACSAPCSSQFEFERGPVAHLSVQFACCMIHLPLKQFIFHVKFRLIVTSATHT